MNLSSTQFHALAPLLILTAAPVVLLLVLAFRRQHRLALALTLLGLLGALVAVGAAVGVAPLQVTPLLLIDRFALFFIALPVLAAAAVALLASGYLRRQDEPREEFYVLLLLATLGCGVLAAAVHFASFFLGLELLSVSLYAMIAYLRARERAVEAGLKYLILAGVSSAFLLFGMALVYAARGAMDFSALDFTARAQDVPGGGRDLWMMTGLGLIVIGVGFKLAVVPFHMWTPDVYEGAPAPVAAFIATASKGAVFALLLRLYGQPGLHGQPALQFLFAAVAITSMLAGNLLALMQTNLKRLLAYSSIAHLGYLLVAFISGGAQAAAAAAVYLAAYFITTLTAFGVITLLSSHEREADLISGYRGLFWQRPWLAGILAAALFSLAGIPLTAGFVGKFTLFVAGARATQWTLLVTLAVGSAIGLFYYLRVILLMLERAGEEGAGRLAAGRAVAAPPLAAWSLAGGLTLAALLVLLLFFGIYPAPLLDWARAATAGVGF